MRLLLALPLLVACADQPVSGLLPEEQALLGCWEGAQGLKTVQYRFHEGRTVDARVVNGETGWQIGTFSVVGDALTYDFGEEPPTYQIDVTTTTFSYRELPFTFARITCP